MIAEALGKSPSMVSKVVSGNARSQVVAEAVAKILNRSVNELFPNQYNWVGKSRMKERDSRVRELKTLLADGEKG